MFTRQKKNYRIFVYAALVITLCILVAALMWPKEAEPVNNDNIGSDNNARIDKSIEESKDNKIDENDNSQSGNNDGDKNQAQESNGDKPVVGEKQDTYYVVKKKGDRISVFFSNENGEEIQLETTDILYELLTPEDQKAFDEGIKADSQEQLSSILQDFES